VDHASTFRLGQLTGTAPGKKAVDWAAASSPASESAPCRTWNVSHADER
jgi:hypothetical protein